MSDITALAETAALVGDPGRANMLMALMDGRALTATELARAAGIAPQTASLHLARMTRAGLLAVLPQGRHRYHRLASAEVARMLESVMVVAAGPGRLRPVCGPRDRGLRLARSCYDHLAGRLAVAMADGMVARGQLDWSADGGALTPAGQRFLCDLGIDTAGAGSRPFCRACLDWSERRPHIGGVLGRALLRGCVSHGWLRRGEASQGEASRAVTVTAQGWRALGQAFALDIGALQTAVLDPPGRRSGE